MNECIKKKGILRQAQDDIDMIILHNNTYDACPEHR